jgi:hypothetical protein
MDISSEFKVLLIFMRVLAKLTWSEHYIGMASETNHGSTNPQQQCATFTRLVVSGSPLGAKALTAV